MPQADRGGTRAPPPTRAESRGLRLTEQAQDARGGSRHAGSPASRAARRDVERHKRRRVGASELMRRRAPNRQMPDRARAGSQSQAPLYVREGIQGAPRVLLDPNALDAKGLVSLD